jgi:sugar phosphate isomerase/epimerase
MRLFIRAHDLGVKGIDNVVAAVKGNGLSGVQMVAYKCLPDVPYAPDGIDETKAAEIKRAFDAANLTIPLIGAYFNPVHSDKEKVKKCVAIFESYLAVANTMGCSVVGSETGSFNDDKWTYNPLNRTDEALDTVVETFQHLADVAAQYNANIAIEGAYGHVCYDVKRLYEAVKRINRPNVKVIFDLYNYLYEGNVDDRYSILEEGLAAFGRNIEIFHLKDCIIDTDGKLRQIAVGKGIFDYTRVIAAIAKSNPNANLVFEGTTGDDIPASVSYIRNTINN